MEVMEIEFVDPVINIATDVMDQMMINVGIVGN